MVAGDCWNMVRVDPTADYNTQAKKRRSDTE